MYGRRLPVTTTTIPRRRLRRDVPRYTPPPYTDPKDGARRYNRDAALWPKTKTLETPRHVFDDFDYVSSSWIRLSLGSAITQFDYFVDFFCCYRFDFRVGIRNPTVNARRRQSRLSCIPNEPTRVRCRSRQVAHLGLQSYFIRFDNGAQCLFKTNGHGRAGRNYSIYLFICVFTDGLIYGSFVVIVNTRQQSPQSVMLTSISNLFHSLYVSYTPDNIVDNLLCCRTRLVLNLSLPPPGYTGHRGHDEISMGSATTPTRAVIATTAVRSF